MHRSHASELEAANVTAQPIGSQNVRARETPVSGAQGTSPRRPGPLDGLSFAVAITAASRMLLLRDRLRGRVRILARGEPLPLGSSRHRLTSGRARLDAVFAGPVTEPATAAVLICHGIAETVDHWLGVQRLLAEHGVASLVFDYAGYGRSTGTVHWAQFENDAVAAFAQLQALTPDLQPSILGFSMGSGVAAAVVDRISPRHLILCAAFTSFQAATCAVGVPKRFASAAPPIWNTAESLRRGSLPPLIVHGGRDRLFPQEMASELAAGCGASAELVIVPAQGHSEPFYRPQLSYWGHVVRRLVSGAGRR